MNFWEIAKKDLRLQVRDARALVVLLVLPILFIATLGLTTGQLLDQKDIATTFKIAVVDESECEFEENGKCELARKIIESLNNDKGLTIREHTRAEAEQLVEDGTANAWLIIGKEFEARYEELGPADILLFKEGPLKEGIEALDMKLETKGNLSSTKTNIENLVFSKSLRHVGEYVLCSDRRLRLFSDEMGERCQKLYPWVLDEGGAAAEDEAADAELKPVPDPKFTPIEEEEVAAGEDRQSEVYQQLVPSYTVMFVFFLVNIMARSFIHERDLGTLRRLRVSPIRPVSLLFGKTVPFMVISLIQSVLLFVCGKLLFGMDWGPEPWMLLPLIACTSLAATSLGLLVATLVKTDSQVSAYGNMVVILMAGISGCFMPREWLPETMKQISLITPHAWALIGYGELLKTRVPDVVVVWKSCAWLVGFSGVYFVAGMFRFGHVD